MGRIRTKFIKKSTKRIMEHYPGSLTSDFEKNKQFLKDKKEIDIYGKKLRNKIAGSAAKLIKDKERLAAAEEKPEEKTVSK